MDPSAPLLPLKRPCCAAGLPPPPLEGDVDGLLESLLLLMSLSPGPAASPSPIGAALERIVESRGGDSEKGRAVEAAVRLGSALLEAARRCERRLAARHNAAAWPLPPDLSVKVFSMLDTQSLCYAAATCSLFYKSTNDPLCYTNIDLMSSSQKVGNGVVCTLIQRAEKNLRSLKLGVSANQSPALTRSFSSSTVNIVDDSAFPWGERRSRPGKESSSILTRSCLLALSIDGGTAGALLKSLHLYNIEKMDTTALCTALLACHSLVDLEVIGLHVELKQTLETLSANCHFIEQLIFESSETGRDDSLRSETCVDLVNGCPNITKLALRGLKLHDQKARIFVKGLRKLKVIDFSTSYSITGTFLRFLCGSANGVEVLMLRDCLHLKEARNRTYSPEDHFRLLIPFSVCLSPVQVEVSRFLTSILSGDCKCLKHLDISNRDGLSSEEDWYDRCYNPSSIVISRVLHERPDIYLVAEFPMERSLTDIDDIFDGELNSDFSLPLTPDSMFTSSPESSFNSDQGMGDGGNLMNFAFFMDSQEDSFQLAG